MRVVIQKVKSASVTVDGSIVSAIEGGLLLLVGVSQIDAITDVNRMIKKIAALRVFEDFSNPPPDQSKWEGKPWSKSLKDDPKLRVLSVSQFTLYGDITKGTKPDLHKAAKGPQALEHYQEFLKGLRKELGGDDRVLDGKFGEKMDVALVNDGPVTLVWDTNDKI